MKRTARLVALCLAMLCMLGISVSVASAQELSRATPISENPGSGVTPDDTPLQTDDVESTATINLTLIIRMTDAGVIPDGMVWRITNSSGFLQEGSVPNGTTGSYQQVISIDSGSYQLYVHTDNDEYRYLGALTIREVDRSVDIKFDRKPGSLTVTVDTNDSGSLPLGSTWNLTNSLNAIVDSGSIAGLADLGTFSTTTVLNYGNYTLNIDAPGSYLPFSTSVRINANPTTFTANLVSLTPPEPADVTLTLTTSDGLEIPNGTVWSFAGQSGTVGAGQASGLVIDLDPVEYGTYALKVNTPGNTFVYNDPAVVVDGPTETLAVELQIGYSDVTLTIKTWDGSDIPAGTEWALVGTDQAGTIDTATPPDVVLNLGSVRYGQYSLLVQTRGRIFRTFSVVTIKEPTREFEVTITDTRVPEGNFATVDITISTDDGTNLPAGTTWQLTETGPGYPVVQSGRVPVATTSPFNVVLPEPVEWGQYVVFVYSPANVYYRSYVVSIYKEEFSTAVELIHRQGDVTATVSTSDGGDIPAGTTWSITDADDTEIQSGTIDGASGTALSLTNPVDYGTYTLTMTDPTGAYLPFVQGFIVEEPVVSLDFTLTVVPPVVGTVNLTITTSDGEPVPTGTIITIGGVTMIVTEDGVTSADIASGTVVTFVDVPQGEQDILVTNAAPYQDFTGTVEIVAGSSVDASITLTRTEEPVTTGSVNLYVSTSDGGNIPAGAVFTINGVSYTATGSEASGSVIPFTGVPEGPVEFSFSNIQPYDAANYTAGEDVTAGTTIDIFATLILDEEPEETGIPPFNPQNPVLPGKTPVPGDTQTGDGTSGPESGTTGGGSGVSALPSTGQNPAGSDSTQWLLLSFVSMLALAALGAAHRMRRQ